MGFEKIIEGSSFHLMFVQKINSKEWNHSHHGSRIMAGDGLDEII